MKRLGQRRIEEHRTPILDMRRRLAVADDDDLLVLPRIPRKQPPRQHQPMLHVRPIHVLIHGQMRQRRRLDLPRQITEPNDVQRVPRISTPNQRVQAPVPLSWPHRSTRASGIDRLMSSISTVADRVSVSERCTTKSSGESRGTARRERRSAEAGGDPGGGGIVASECRSRGPVRPPRSRGLPLPQVTLSASRRTAFMSVSRTSRSNTSPNS